MFASAMDSLRLAFARAPETTVGPPAAAAVGEVKELLQHYTPGEHWLHVQRQLPKEDALEMGDEAAAWVRSSLLSLLPVYHMILWDPS